MSPATIGLRRHRWVAAISLLAIVGTAACGSDDAGTGASTPDTPETTSDLPETTEATPPATSPATTSPTTPTAPDATPPDSTAPAEDGGTSVPSSMQSLVDIAVADLADRLALDDPSPIAVTSIEEVTWRDRALGCPRKDMQYAQVLTPGYRIVLTVDGTNYQYHGGDGRDPFYCATPETPAP